MQRITELSAAPLFDIAASRRIETAAARTLAPHTLMRRAGLAVARLAMAVAPHARCIWIACGPGNNGGDGFEAAVQLRQRGFMPIVTFAGSEVRLPDDARDALTRARAAGVSFLEEAPANFDLAIDALLGIGAARAPEGQMAQWLARMYAGPAPLLSVDLPSGLHADTGALAHPLVSQIGGMAKRYCLNLLTLKPGVFTAHGRDAAGEIWFDDLGACRTWIADSENRPQRAQFSPDLQPHSPAMGQKAGEKWAAAVDLQPATSKSDRLLDSSHAWASESPIARLAGAPTHSPRPHASHKGNWGDVAVVGGAPGMGGAALLAATAALHSGAGRVFAALLDPSAPTVDPQKPALMLRRAESLAFDAMTVVCGCGGGTAVRTLLPRVLASAPRAVLDADALNAIATDESLQQQLRARAARGRPTVLTPHPLEAARLLGISAAEVQADRLAAAGALARRYAATVVLKGSGSITAAEGQVPVINLTGNARLASAGTGDVLAGMIGAALAAHGDAFEAAWQAVWRHGAAADHWPPTESLTADALAQRLMLPVSKL